MSEDEGRIIWGLLLCWGLNLLHVGLGFLAIGDLRTLAAPIVLIGGIGLVQLIYVVPLYLNRKTNGKAATAKGLVIAASITALLNATCWGMFMGH
jgi:hypothetical protein